MGYWMDILIRRMHQRALARVGELAGELVEAPSDDKELILAEMEFERWKAEYCAWCMEGR